MNWPSRLLISAYALSGPFSLMNTTALFTMATASSLVAFSAANDDPPMRAAKTGAAIIHTNIRTRIISRSYPTSAVTPPQPFLVCARPLGSARTTPTRGIIPAQLPVAGNGLLDRWIIILPQFGSNRLKSEECAKFLGHRPWRAEAVGRMAVVAIADRHRAEQHVLRRDFQEFADDPVHAAPGFLRTRVETAAAREIRQGVNVAAEIGPLAGPEVAVDGDEERHRRVEELEVALVLGESAGRVVARHAERAVELHAVLLAARLVRFPHHLRIDRILGLVVPRIAIGDVRGDAALDLGERSAGERVDAPGLQVPARRRARRLLDQVADDLLVDRFVEEPAAADAGVDRFEDVHVYDVPCLQ